MKKCRLRNENATRWSSAFLMLESVDRAYKRNAFVEANVVFPIEHTTVRKYYKVLLGLYHVTMGFQRSKSSIAEVIPSLKKEIYVLENIKLPDVYKSFGKVLAKCLKAKFRYELDSSIYMVYIFSILLQVFCITFIKMKIK